jgi:flavin reductase (DIM6/NTAB) family NADH-FMN oxidoreductase RutF/rubredoxin
MINYEALFNISYGLYIVCSGDKAHGNGFISNTVFQVTNEPAQFAACCNKNNFTAGLIQKSGAFSVSILHTETSPDIIGKFGYRSGKDEDKLIGSNIRYGETGVPIVIDDTIGFLECKVVQTVDAGTHLMFIGELVSAEILDDKKNPMTYLYYRETRKGVAPKNAPTYIDKSKLQPQVKESDNKKHKCPLCGFIHDDEKENIKFDDLPNDWICPICGCEKSEFIKI